MKFIYSVDIIQEAEEARSPTTLTMENKKKKRSLKKVQLPNINTNQSEDSPVLNL